MNVVNDVTSSDATGYTKEVCAASRRLGTLIFKAAIGTLTADERAELDLLAVETPALLKEMSAG